MNGFRIAANVGLAAALSVALHACGGGSSPSAPSPGGGGGGGPVQTNTITITGSGVSPANVQIAVGTRVMFVNSDSRSHEMSSDPHPAHTQCSELNIGSLQPGQSRETQPVATAKTCGFHDHENPNSSSLRGSIRAQ